MNSTTLTICIPSYNRPQSALNCVKTLLSQEPGETVHISVLDNSSEDNYIDIFNQTPETKKAIADGILSVHRNNANIGMSANFMRAFERSQGEWLWLLSDDDNIRTDAIKTILSKIENQPEQIGFIKFSSERTKEIQDETSIESLEELIDLNSRSIDAFNGFLFISNGVYKLRHFRDFLHIGYLYANTYIPHFMMLIFYIFSGKKGVIYNSIIVDYTVPKKGYSYGLLAGLGVGAPKHIMIKLSKPYYQKLLKIFFPHNDYKVIIDLYYQSKKDGTPYVFNYLAKCYHSYARQNRSILRNLSLFTFIRLAKSPTLFEATINAIASRNELIKRHVEEIRSRYPLQDNATSPNK